MRKNSYSTGLYIVEKKVIFDLKTWLSSSMRPNIFHDGFVQSHIPTEKG